MSERTDTCDRCGAVLHVGDYPFCPHGRGANAAIGDDIPGGLTVENLGREPVTVYTKSGLLREAKARGLEPFVRHVPLPGSDKSPHTTNWAAGMDAQTLANAAELVGRARRTRGQDPPDPDGWAEWGVRTRDAG